MTRRNMFRVSAAVTAIAVLIGGVTGCGSGDRKTLRVLAAASLVDVMTTLTNAFHDDHPEVTVQVDTAASSELVRRLASGADGDVLVTADTRTMDQAVEQKVAADPVIVATNVLVIVVPQGNPGHVTGLDFFARPGARSVVCASEVPCGAAADAALAGIGATPQPISRAPDVRAALGSVTRGEADAALVYATDARSAGDKVETIAIPHAPVNQYPAASLTDAGRDFVTLMTSSRGRDIFTAAGFGVP